MYLVVLGPSTSKIQRTRVSGIYQEHTPDTNILISQLGSSDKAQWIIEGLGLWYEISPFLCIAHVKDKVLYPAKLDKFDSDVNKFYAAGANTFLFTKFIGDE